METTISQQVIYIIDCVRPNLQIIEEALEECSIADLRVSKFESESAVKHQLEILSSISNITKPGIILLHCEGPSGVGMQILKRIKNDKNLHTNAVIIYSKNTDQDFVNECYTQHANAFLEFREDHNAFKQSLKSLLNFWFTVVVPPGYNKEF